MNQYIAKYKIHLKPGMYLIGCYLVSCCLGMLIIRNDPRLLLIAFALPVGLVLFASPKIALCLIMVSVFFADWLMQLKLIPAESTLIPEAGLIVLAIRVAIIRMREKKFIKTSLQIPILLFIVWGFLSALINSQQLATTIIGFRYELKYILMFFLVINLNFAEQFFKRIINSIIVLLLVQVPVALIKMQFYGQGEAAIGTYAGKGGALSTILPLIAISIFLGLFLFEKPRISYILSCLLFFSFSIIGGKRAFVFLVVLLTLFLFWHSGKKHFIKFAFVAPFFMVGVLACVYFVPAFHPTFENPQHFIDFSVSYTTAHNSETGAAIGRASALEAAFNESIKKPVTFLFGFGPGSISPTYFKRFESGLRDKLPIDYGHSQWVTMSLEYGWGGVLLFLWLFIPLFQLNQKLFQATSDPYWKAISFGFKGILFTYLMGFFYSVVFRFDLLAFIFWFFAAAIFCLGKQYENSMDNTITA